MENSTEATLQKGGSNESQNQQSMQAQISPAVLQQRFDELTYAATLSPAIKESPEYKEVEKGLRDLADKVVKNQPKAQTQKATTTLEEHQEEEEDEDESKNPFLTKKKTSKVPDKIDNIEEYMKKKYSVEDPSKFFASVDKWRNDAQEKSKAQEELDGILADLEKAPDPLKAALLAHSNGRDWQDELASYVGRPDFNKSYDNNNTENLVKFYFKDDYKTLQEQLNDGDLDEDDYNKQMKLLQRAVKPLFEKDKGVFNDKRAAHMKAADEFDKNLRASVNSSVDALKNEFPDFKSSDIQKLKQALVNGNVNGFFFEKNGTYRKDAAKRLAFVMYGDDLYSVAVEKAERKGMSQANEEIVSRGQKEIANSKTTQAAQDKVAQDAVAHLTSMNKKKDYLQVYQPNK